MSNSGGCRTRKQQVADAGQASLGKCVWLKAPTSLHAMSQLSYKNRKVIFSKAKYKMNQENTEPQ
ncbi:hypothetical protein CWN92_02325 [Vibrio splendidus]|nr:hypothetical protein CWN92_02325 [Vibrio splendidus]